MCVGIPTATLRSRNLSEPQDLYQLLEKQIARALRTYCTLIKVIAGAQADLTDQIKGVSLIPLGRGSGEKGMLETGSSRRTALGTLLPAPCVRGCSALTYPLRSPAAASPDPHLPSLSAPGGTQSHTAGAQRPQRGPAPTAGSRAGGRGAMGGRGGPRAGKCISETSAGQKKRCSSSACVAPVSENDFELLG